MWEHSDNLIYRLEKRFELLSGLMDRSPLVITPFDAELFGHWWFEGSDGIESVIRKISRNGSEIRLITPSQYLDIHPLNQKATPSYSSWGNRGYSEFWLDGKNAWI